MNWVLQRLAAAMIAGIGFKLGGDIYDSVKTKVTDRVGDKDKSGRDEDPSTATAAVSDQDIPLESEEVCA